MMILLNSYVVRDKSLFCCPISLFCTLFTWLLPSLCFPRSKVGIKTVYHNLDRDVSTQLISYYVLGTYLIYAWYTSIKSREHERS